MLAAFLGYLRRLPSKGAVQQLNLGILAVYGAGVRSGLAELAPHLIGDLAG